MEQTPRKDLAGDPAGRIQRTGQYLLMLAGGAFALAGGIVEWQETQDSDPQPAARLPDHRGLSAGRGLDRARRTGWPCAASKTNPSEPMRIQSTFRLGGNGFVRRMDSFHSDCGVPPSKGRSCNGFRCRSTCWQSGCLSMGSSDLALGGLELGSKLRAWGTLSAGMTLAPLLSILAEGMVALVIAIIAIGIFVGTGPATTGGHQGTGGTTENA